MGIIKVLETIGQMSSDETSKDEACLGLKGGSFSEKWRYFSVSHCIPHTMYQHVSSLACEYMVVVQNSFFSKRPFLAEKKNYFSQTFAILTKNFRGAICVSERPSKLILWRLRIHVWRFAFIGGPCSPSLASSDTPHRN